ncbi:MULTISPECIES: serine O-acetyltransferase EpsC [unclassified Novosphingobium]|jgi:serine O-acetyltransferase|uniref:serine O-acetyltransferase EpsC n=1 Tax=unclassified Novosphingobium TaxID=2644732 RepID=UPI00061BD6D0|nr:MULTISPECIES: serine O-acetyltransferase EpsC [unclassified Novosphingobium]MBF5089782.1 serine acetyltransferase [Novosphingobium sp. NBM11]QCI94572.1 serine acetyltransferase [Novosphingobium sp. EMRT-2]RQW43142.1 serine acetyltransferase [Novosphingobium sp. LASN5T]GAO53769.1 serine acetyltransferase [Novosphingobium sp. MD-1]
MFAKLIDYLDSIQARDPAPRSRWEILLYPGLWAVALHRVAHWLFQGKLYFLARAVNHFSRFMTGIDIHPGAKIGRHLFIDHGFTVIGETAEIGDNVTIYQCVTLGGTNPANGVPGKRHPTLQDNAIIGSGAQILGPITVGQRARVGANAVVTEDVPEGATMIGLKARSTLVPVETWLKDFIPYGTPCKEPCEPAGGTRVDELEAEVAALKAQVAALVAAQLETADGDGTAPSPTRRRSRT